MVIAAVFAMTYRVVQRFECQTSQAKKKMKMVCLCNFGTSHYVSELMLTM